MRHYWVSFSVVSASGYALFLPYAYAMHQIFAMNNYIFVPLVLFVITTLLVVAHKQARPNSQTSQDVDMPRQSAPPGRVHLLAAPQTA